MRDIAVTNYLHICEFRYNYNGIRLNNWLDGEIDGKKVLMYWWDGMTFLPNMTKTVTIKSAVQLTNNNFDFIVDGITIGQGNVKSTRVFKHNLPKF